MRHEAPPAARARALGRVNLIGEHTDYNGGYVLPIAIPLGTEVRLWRRDDTRVTAESAAFAGEVSYALGTEGRLGGWVDYLQGVTALLRSGGASLGGFDAMILSDLPAGAGLSSSAALEVALLRALRSLFELSLDDISLAKLGQRVETDFVGAPTGIMDQMAACLASVREALFLDTRSLGYELLPLPESVELVVVDSGVSHAHAGGEYATRRAQCEEAAALLGAGELRELEGTDLLVLRDLPELLARRARHVITENARVRAAARALRSGDMVLLGDLFTASHASMRDDYEVSVPEVDALVDALAAEPSVFGARLTGGGFGGSVIALAQAGSGAACGARAASRVKGARLLLPGPRTSQSPPPPR